MPKDILIFLIASAVLGVSKRVSSDLGIGLSLFSSALDTYALQRNRAMLSIAFRKIKVHWLCRLKVYPVFGTWLLVRHETSENCPAQLKRNRPYRLGQNSNWHPLSVAASSCNSGQNNHAIIVVKKCSKFNNQKKGKYRAINYFPMQCVQ